MTLTAKKVAAAKPRDAVFELADGDGLTLVVQPSGRRTWRLRYRVDGVRKRVVLGSYPDVSLARARKDAAALRGDIARGGDPAEERQARREALTMRDLFGTTGGANPGWYLATYVRTAGRLGTAKTPKGIANDRSYIGKHLRPRKPLMRKRVADVTVGDLNRIKAEVSPAVWRKVRGILRVAFQHAEEVDAIPRGSNPALRTKAKTDAKRERFLTPPERQRLEDALRRAEAVGPTMQGVARGEAGGLSPHLVRAVRLLLLTGMRRGDVLQLRWEQVDWEHGRLRLPTSKTGARDAPLTPQARGFLKTEHRRAAEMLEVGAPRGLVCCTSSGGPVAPENLTRAWRSLRKRAGLDGSDGKPAVRLHDARHSWASDAISAGVPLAVVGRVLGHKVPATTARYAHLHDEAVQDGLAKAGDAIAAATEAGVVPISGRSKAR